MVYWELGDCFVGHPRQTSKWNRYGSQRGHVPAPQRRLDSRLTDAQKKKLSLSVPMATLHGFVTVAQGLAPRDDEVCCLLHEFKSSVCAQMAAQVPRTSEPSHHLCFSLSQPQHQCTVLHEMHTPEGQTCPNNTIVHSKDTKVTRTNHFAPTLVRLLYVPAVVKGCP